MYIQIYVQLKKTNQRTQAFRMFASEECIIRLIMHALSSKPKWVFLFDVQRVEFQIKLSDYTSSLNIGYYNFSSFRRWLSGFYIVLKECFLLSITLKLVTIWKNLE